MFPPDERLSVRAYAKINLYLEVLGRRENGYHDLRSLVMPVSLCDDISIERADSGVISEMVAVNAICREGVEETASDGNLTTRAAETLRAATGCKAGARIQIEKRIPIGGGLGGGSADAAAVFVGLNRFWNLGVPVERLMEIGATVGSDVPALIHGGAVWMEGVGEKVRPCADCEGLADAPWWLVLVYPGFPVSTGDIYRRYQSCLTPGDGTVNNFRFALKRGDVALAAANLFNSLQETVFGKYPLIGLTAEYLREAGALGALVSGSGASVFGLASSREHAREVEVRVQQRMGQAVWTQVASTLPGGVMVAHGPLEPFV